MPRGFPFGVVYEALLLSAVVVTRLYCFLLVIALAAGCSAPAADVRPEGSIEGRSSPGGVVPTALTDHIQGPAALSPTPAAETPTETGPESDGEPRGVDGAGTNGTPQEFDPPSEHELVNNPPYVPGRKLLGARGDQLAFSTTREWYNAPLDWRNYDIASEFIDPEGDLLTFKTTVIDSATEVVLQNLSGPSINLSLERGRDYSLEITATDIAGNKGTTRHYVQAIGRIVLLHGWGDTGRQWDAMIPKLERDGYDVLDFRNVTGERVLSYAPRSGEENSNWSPFWHGHEHLA